MKDNFFETKRKELDIIDEEICSLLNKRFDITKEIGREKYCMHLPIENRQREKEILKRINKVKNKNEIKQVYEKIFEISKSKQNYDFFLVGKNISYSISPYIHSLLGINNYNIYDGDLNEALSGEYRGVNITIPYKKEALEYADVISDEIKKTGVCNTLVKKNGKVYAYNNDYFAFIRIFEYFKFDIENKKVIIIGNGATSESAFWALKEKSPKTIIKLVRNKKENNEDFIENYQNHLDASIIINTTPYGTSPHYENEPLFPLENFKALETVIDVVYNPLATPLIKEAIKLGIKTINGLYMMVSQAALSEELFVNNNATLKINEVYKKAAFSLENIILIGMPHSGKTTIGRKLSEGMDKEFIDIDELLSEKGITLKHDPTVNDLLTFRNAEENETINQACDFGKVISTGGGIVLNSTAMMYLKNNGIIVFLDVDLKELQNRVDGTRPITPTVSELNKIYEQRYLLYRSYADIILKGNFTIEEIKEKIYEYSCNKWS